MLWAVVGLTAIAGTMLGNGRNDVALASNLREAALAQQAADGAVFRAGLHLLPCGDDGGCAAWPTDGSRVEVASPGVAIGVCLLDESAKINPNLANAALLEALLGVVGVEASEAGRLAAAIVQWRSPATPDAIAAQAETYRAAGLPLAPDGQRFTGIDDLRFVLGMTEPVLTRLRPSLSVWADGDPDPERATPAVRAALRAIGVDAAAPRIPGATPRTVQVIADAVTRGGGRFVRGAVLRVTPAADRPPVQVLTWSADPDAACR